MKYIVRWKTKGGGALFFSCFLLLKCSVILYHWTFTWKQGIFWSNKAIYRIIKPLLFFFTQRHKEYSEACAKLAKLQSAGAEAAKVLHYLVEFFIKFFLYVWRELIRSFATTFYFRFQSYSLSTLSQESITICLTG